MRGVMTAALAGLVFVMAGCDNTAGTKTTTTTTTPGGSTTQTKENKVETSGDNAPAPKSVP